MKNVFIYAENDISKNISNKLVNCYKISPDNFIVPSTNTEETNFVIADTDLKNCNLEALINAYKKYNAKFLAYTKNTSKENILKLYDLGFDNVIPTPQNLENVIKNTINPENKDVSSKDYPTYSNTKKILIISDSKISSELLTTALAPLDFIYTIRNSIKQAKNDIKKDNFDLIITDSKNIDEQILETSTEISQSKFNNQTPHLILTDKKEEEIEAKNYELGAYNHIEKPYTARTLCAQIKNILKIKELENAIKTENSLLDSMISNSFNQLIITDTNFVILGGGQQFIPITQNEYFFNTLKNLNIDFPQDKIRIFSRSSEKNIKFIITNKDKTFEIRISKVYKSTNVFEQYLIIIEDITEKLLIEEQKETFIATLTHDLKSPIRAEQNIIKQMLDEKFGTLTETQKNILKEILNSKEYENKMIDNLLTRYHISTDSFKLFIEKNNYKNTIQTAVNETNNFLESKKQKIEVNYNANTTFFEFDKTEIKRVLTNLLQNAIEYSPQNSKIQIEITENEKNIITKVIDNGYGIKKELINQIFDKNVSLAKKYRKVGAGLGLYICKTLINAHNGIITVESKPNNGSTFTFTLPKN